MARPKKAEGETVARLGLTLPPGLKEEMESVPEQVNWSSVAAEAFRCKLTQLQAERGGPTMDQVIERMRAARRVTQDQDYKAGTDHAEVWVKHHAHPDDLARLEHVVSGFDDGMAGMIELIAQEEGETMASELYGRMFGERNPDHADVADFWANVIGLGDGWFLTANSRSYARGFAERCLELWAKIKDKL